MMREEEQTFVPMDLHKMFLIPGRGNRQRPRKSGLATKVSVYDTIASMICFSTAGPFSSVASSRYRRQHFCSTLPRNAGDFDSTVERIFSGANVARCCCAYV